MNLFVVYFIFFFNAVAYLKGSSAIEELYDPLVPILEDSSSSPALPYPQLQLPYSHGYLPYPVSSSQPTVYPTSQATKCPTPDPTLRPTIDPTPQPTLKPTLKPTIEPTRQPTLKPTMVPTLAPTTSQPSSKPSFRPTYLKECVKNSDCENDSCGRGNADVESGEALVCCNLKGLSEFFFSYYCTQLPNGTSCWTNDMCQSNFCRDNGVVNNGLPRQRGTIIRV